MNGLEKEMDRTDWNGTWEDSDGYWVKIDISEESILLSRSGSLKSKLTFQEFSENFDSMIYIEKGDGLNFEHTLRFQEDGTVEDSWLDIKKKTVWKREVLHNKARSNTPAIIDQGPASKAVFDDGRYNDLQVDLLSRLLQDIKLVLEEELTEFSQEKLCDIAEKIGFSVTSTLDGCDVIGDNVTSMPHVSFRADGKVITNNSGSFMHEMVSGFFDDKIS